MHARRKFDEVLKIGAQNSHSLAAGIVEDMQEIWAVERDIKDASIEERLAVRQLRSKPVMEALKRKLEEHLPKVPPKSRLGNGMLYLQNDWEAFTRFLSDGRLSVDNSRAENAIRPFAIGRKNWLFSDTPRGAMASATLYSLLATAKAHKLNTFEYMNDVLKKMAVYRDSKNPQSEFLDALLPWNWRPEKNQQ